MAREAGHPQLYAGWATPPPLGRVLVLVAYWAVVAYLMAWRAVVDDVYYWERIGYRNGWIAAAQLPMAYLLAMKLNPVAWLAGTSHERLNWLHRWVARTMLVTATVHGFFFWTEWARADFIADQLDAMPIVRYGLGAWAVLLWTVVVGFVPVRRLAYEAWLAQHVVSAVVLLWLLYRHMPASARYLLWMAVAMLVGDRAARWLLLLRCNTRWRPGPGACPGRRRFGHDLWLRAVGDAVTVVTVGRVPFAWRPGQHVYLWLPRLGALEAHPYTIACARRAPVGGACRCCSSLQLVVRAHDGFSRRLHTFAARNPGRTLTGFLCGPFGAPPRCDIYETLVLIGASTGASFIVPMLESAAEDRPTCVRRIDAVLVARTTAEIDCYLQRAAEAARRVHPRGIAVRLHVAVTGGGAGDPGGGAGGGDAGVPLVRLRSEAACAGSSSGNRSSNGSSTTGSTGGDGLVMEHWARPDLEALIREPVEQAWGETAVVVCGGKQLVARTRNCVSRLSDERAVHKGTGAQGIFLFVEEYAL